MREARGSNILAEALVDMSFVGGCALPALSSGNFHFCRLPELDEQRSLRASSDSRGWNRPTDQREKGEPFSLLVIILKDASPAPSLEESCYCAQDEKFRKCSRSTYAALDSLQSCW
jgi:hypothetical protein